jgi:hypothetical protein
MEIHERDGKSTEVGLFISSSIPEVPFRIGDRYYRGGSFEKLRTALMARMPSRR